jgi:hypothetical protein
LALLSLLLVAGVVAGGYFGLRQVYFLGTDEGGRLALFRGLPYDLPLGVDLYSEVYSTPVQVDSLPADRRPSVTEHELRSRDDAVSLLNDLEAEVREPQPKPADKSRKGDSKQADSSRQTAGGKRDEGGRNRAGGGRSDRRGQRQRSSG